jgi:SAM-dependent methyltransferase
VTAFGQGAGQFAAEQAAGAGDEDAQQITRHQRTIRLAPYAPPRHPIGTKTPRPRFSTRPLGIAYLVADATDLPFASGSFDFATAFMSMMDMANHGGALCEAARVLRPGGFLQFSILHPCFVPPHRRVLREPNGTTRAIEVGGYFDATDGRIDTFRFENLPEEERQKTEPSRRASQSRHNSVRSSSQST